MACVVIPCSRDHIAYRSGLRGAEADTAMPLYGVLCMLPIH